MGCRKQGGECFIPTVTWKHVVKRFVCALGGEADLTVHSHGSSSICFEEEKPFCTFRDRSGDFVATALSFLAHSACPVTPVRR